MTDLIGWLSLPWMLRMIFGLGLMAALYRGFRRISRNVHLPMVRKLLFGVAARVESIAAEAAGVKAEIRLRPPGAASEHGNSLQDRRHVVPHVQARPHARGLTAVPVLREVVTQRVEESSLRRIAREIGMSPTGLKQFIDGATPYVTTRRKLQRWYLCLAADQRGA